MLEILKITPVTMGSIVTSVVVIGKFPDDSCKEFKDKSMDNPDYSSSCVLEIVLTLKKGEDLWNRLLTQYLTQVKVMRTRDGSIKPLLDEDSLEIKIEDSEDSSKILSVKYMDAEYFNCDMLERFENVNSVLKKDVNKLIELLKEIEQSLAIEPPDTSLEDNAST